MNESDKFFFASLASFVGGASLSSSITSASIAPDEMLSSINQMADNPGGASSLTTSVVAGVGSSIASSGGDVIEFEIKFKNDIQYNSVDRSAKEVYDTFDKKHIKVSDTGTSVVLTSSPVRELFDELVQEKDPSSVVEELEVIKKVYQKTIKK